MKKFTEEEALNRAMAQCSLTEYCRVDVEDKILKWNVSHEATERILDQLTAEDFINEERYCRAFINDKFRIAKWGKQKIADGLRLKKMPRDMVWRFLNEIDQDEYLGVLEEILASKRKSVRAESDYELNAKLIRFALSRGFQMDDIRRYVWVEETDEK